MRAIFFNRQESKNSYLCCKQQVFMGVCREDGCSYVPGAQWEVLENSLGSKRSTGDLERRRRNMLLPCVLYTLQGATIHTATKARQPETRESADFSLFRPPMLSHWGGLILPSNTAPGQPSFLSRPPATLHQLFLPALKSRAVNILEHCLCIKQCAWCRAYK